MLLDAEGTNLSVGLRLTAPLKRGAKEMTSLPCSPFRGAIWLKGQTERFVPRPCIPQAIALMKLLKWLVKIVEIV